MTEGKNSNSNHYLTNIFPCTLLNAVSPARLNEALAQEPGLTFMAIKHVLTWISARTTTLPGCSNSLVT